MSGRTTRATGLLLISFSVASILSAQTISQNGPSNKAIAEPSWDFEADLQGWKKTGTAFNNQPFDGSKVVTNSQQFENIGGDYWKGVKYPLGQHGQHLILTSDPSTGTLTSDPFTLPTTHSYFSFLIGGSSDIAHERFEFQVLSTSPADAADIARETQQLSKTKDSHLQCVRLPDDDYVTVSASTGIYGPGKTLLDLLRQESIEITQILFGRTARLRIIDCSATGHINVDYIRVTETAPPPLHAPAFGFADYHTHLMSNIAFGALKGVSTLWGCPGGTYEDYECDKKLIARDIPNCIPNHGGGLGAEVFINSAEHRINLDFGPLAVILDLLRRRVLHHPRSGGPKFHDFPSFLSGTHQQMHITQIRRNYDGGLRLLLALAVHNQGAEYLASKAKHGRIDPSTEREVVHAQVRAIRELAELNKDWMEVAFSPAEARDIIRRNKLAIVIGIEVDRLGELDPSSVKDQASAEKEIAELWELGIRAVTPMHAVDNWIGGPAVFFDTYNGLNDFLNRHDAQNPHLYNLRFQDSDEVDAQFFRVEEGCATAELGKCVLYRLNDKQNRLVLAHLPIVGDFPFLKEVDAGYSRLDLEGHKNVNGLTDYGRIYINELMNQGMILDIAHMSEKSVADTFNLIGQRLRPKAGDCAGFAFGTADDTCYKEAYPTVVSHIFFRAQALFYEKTTVKDFVPSEYQLSDSTVEIVRRVDGVIGPMAWELPLHVKGVQKPAPFKNDCAMSSKGFGYAFRYALERMKGVGVGMATDFTFIPGAGPRFGKNACWAYNLAKHPDEERELNPNFYNSQAQDNGVKYKNWVSTGVKVREDVEIKPYYMGLRKKPFDFNVEGLAHYGMVPDMLQDLKNIGMPREDFEALFSSAEAYIQMWEKTWRVAGCDPPNSKCQSEPSPIPTPTRSFCPLPGRRR